jgi:hypothetical protein
MEETMRRKEEVLRFGDLIAALFEEAAKITPLRKLQTRLVCAALMDMQGSRAVSPAFRKKKLSYAA